MNYELSCGESRAPRIAAATPQQALGKLCGVIVSAGARSNSEEPVKAPKKEMKNDIREPRVKIQEIEMREKSRKEERGKKSELKQV